MDDISIKFITQQYVIRPKGRALTDMYFPQLGLHIEVDESYHLKQIEQDLLREADIVNATSHKILRVNTNLDINSVNKQIDNIIKEIKTCKSNSLTFKPWDIELEQNPIYYIKKGFIDIDDDVAFKKSYLAANCFGYNYRGFQKAATRHLFENNKIIWFPKLYINSGWNNSISDDDEIIIEKSIHSIQHTFKIINGPKENRIVFARVKNPLGEVMYRFKGGYTLDLTSSSPELGLVWKRISTRVNTYSSQ